MRVDEQTLIEWLSQTGLDVTLLDADSEFSQPHITLKLPFYVLTKELPNHITLLTSNVEHIPIFTESTRYSLIHNLETFSPYVAQVCLGESSYEDILQQAANQSC